MDAPKTIEDVLNLPEGRVVVSSPANLSEDSVADMTEFFCLIAASAKRAVKTQEEAGRA